MNVDEARLELFSFFADHLEARDFFRKEAGSLVRPREKAALIIQSVVAWGQGPKTSVLFVCGWMLEPESPLVRGWVDECIEAARREAPEAMAAANELVVGCVKHTMPGLEQ